jgi:monothiol glutaredoxin
MPAQPTPNEAHARVARLVAENEVMLFMKGNRTAPQCGFSATVVSILDQLLPDYATFDVLSDPQVRNGVKEFSSWPTVPQLYVRGEFLGGCDIVRELFASGELFDQLGVAPPSPPRLAVSEAAARVLRGMAEEREVKDLHLRVDGSFQNSLYFGPGEPGEIRVDAGGIQILVDPGTALRSDGLSIDVIETEQGPGFRIENPAARDASGH